MNIEEAKKQLQIIRKIRREQKEIIEEAGGVCVNCDEDIMSIDIILIELERLQKENEELKVIKSLIQTLELNQAKEDKYILITKRDFLSGSYKKLLDDYISKQKIKYKIKEVKNEENLYAKENIIKVLNELLEEKQ